MPVGVLSAAVIRQTQAGNICLCRCSAAVACAVLRSKLAASVWGVKVMNLLQDTFMPALVKYIALTRLPTTLHSWTSLLPLHFQGGHDAQSQNQATCSYAAKGPHTRLVSLCKSQLCRQAS